MTTYNKYPPRLKIFSSSEKRELEKRLEEQFGIKKISGTIIKSGKDRLFLFEGNLNEKQIRNLEQTLPIERIGVYFATEVEGENKIRLSIEGTHIFKEQITKNIFELTKEQLNDWMLGRELNLQTGKRDFLIMKYKDDFFGTGKASELKISNFIPKSRRLKEKS